jgi:hypothetical protein
MSDIGEIEFGRPSYLAKVADSTFFGHYINPLFEENWGDGRNL